VFLDFHCAAWDPETRLCRIYERRHLLEQIVGERCLGIPDAILNLALPTSCPYTPAAYKTAEYDPARLKMVPRSLYRYIRIKTEIERIRLNRFLKREARDATTHRRGIKDRIRRALRRSPAK